MTRSSTFSRAALCAAALALGIAGCSGGTSPGGSGPAAGGGVLTVATAEEVKTVDPALAYDTWSTAVVHACTRRLVDYDMQGQIVPDLAERWDISEDGKVYTFALRKDAKFSDGTPIQAKHFQAAIERVKNPDTASPGADFYRGIDSLETPDEHTLVVVLGQPDPTLLNVLGLTFAAPIPEGESAAKPPASGPYQVESFEQGARAVLSRNPHDPRASGMVERIVVQMNVEESLQRTRFQNGEVDLLPAVPPMDYARIMAMPSEKDNVAQGVVNQTWYFGMNTRKAPWNDPRVRHAALLAINRARHVDIAGPGQVANGILPPHVPGYDPERKLPEPDPEQARRLLAEAGYPSGLPASMKSTMWLASTPQYRRHAEAIQSDLQAVGIPVELRAVSFGEYLTGYKQKADCWYGGWYPDFPDAGNFLEPVLHGRSIRPGGPNVARYDNPKVNALLDLAHTMPRGEKRQALYRQAEDQILLDLPWIPLYFEVETRYFRDGVRGVTVHPVWRQMLTGISKGG
ncbi:MAG: ABC transporter substrate-binding protein [Armatimonadota bacterium]